MIINQIKSVWSDATSDHGIGQETWLVTLVLHTVPLFLPIL